MKGKTRSSVVDAAWKDVLQQADKSRLRKAKHDAKSGAVSGIRIKDGFITATVKASGPERGSFQVALPWLADYRSHGSQVAMWLARRPDWIAAHFAGVWESDFAQFLKANGIDVFPNDATWSTLEANSKCTCSDWQSVCAHKLTLLNHLIGNAEEHPLHIFQFVGLDVSYLLDGAHRESVALAKLEPTYQRIAQAPAAEKSVGLNELLEEIEPVAPLGRLVPQFHPDRAKQWL